MESTDARSTATESQKISLEWIAIRIYSEEGCLLLFRGHVCVPIMESLKKKILQEAYGLAYAMHPGSIKMYQNMR